MTKTDADLQESLSDLYRRLEARGAKPEHLTAVEDWMRRESDADAARLARLYYGREEGEKITPLAFPGASNSCPSAPMASSTLSKPWSTRPMTINSLRERGGLSMPIPPSISDRLKTAFDLEQFASDREPEIAGDSDRVTFSPRRHETGIKRRHRPGRSPSGQSSARAERAALMSIATCPCEAEEIAPKFYHLLDELSLRLWRGLADFRRARDHGRSRFSLRQGRRRPKRGKNDGNRRG